MGNIGPTFIVPPTPRGTMKETIGLVDTAEVMFTTEAAALTGAHSWLQL